MQVPSFGLEAFVREPSIHGRGRFLLVENARALPTAEPLDEPRAFAFVYSLLGAVHYFAVPEPPLSQMYGQRRYAAIRRQMGVELQALVRARVMSLVARCGAASSHCSNSPH